MQLSTYWIVFASNPARRRCFEYLKVVARRNIILVNIHKDVQTLKHVTLFLMPLKMMAHVYILIVMEIVVEMQLLMNVAYAQVEIQVMITINLLIVLGIVLVMQLKMGCLIY